MRRRCPCRGWPEVEITGARHLAPATEPVEVAGALLELERTLAEALRSPSTP
jgi:hypothetical protein